MRIVSFLPSATEVLFALGLEDEVVGVTFECDFPAEASSKPQVVHSHLPAGLTPVEIDQLVRDEGAQGKSLYFADMSLFTQLAPDLIILQDLCRVCAIDSPTMARDLGELPSRPELLSLSAHTLEDVLNDIERVGKSTGRSERAQALTASLRARRETVERRPPPPQRTRVLALEWLHPFFQGGHWIPEMIALAGGDAVLAEPGAKSVRLSWEQVRSSDPEVLIIMPCGYHLDETIEQYRTIAFPEGWESLPAVTSGRVYAVDGSAYFSRSGPRLLDGLEILAALLREEPGAYVSLSKFRAARLDAGSASSPA